MYNIVLSLENFRSKHRNIAPKKMSQICIFYLSVHPRPRARNHELSGDPCFRENRPDYTRRSVYKLENLSFVKNKYR